MSDVLSILASMTLLGVVWMYYHQVKASKSVPNPATWLLWTSAGFINMITYDATTGGYTTQWLISLVMTAGLGFMFCHCWWRGKFSRMGGWEYLALSGCIALALYWVLSGAEKTEINNYVQVVLVISFIPTIHKLIKRETVEAYPAWTLAVLAYGLQIFGILSDPSWRVDALWFPLINGIVGNGSVLVVIYLTKRRNLRSMLSIVAQNRTSRGQS